MPPNDVQEVGPPATYRSPDKAAGRARPGRIGVALGVVLLAALAVAVYTGIRTRSRSEQDLVQSTERAAIPTIEVIHPKTGAATAKLVLPGNTQAFNDTAIYARTNGYLKRWYFDIGAHVKRGELLAEIDTPEVDAQLSQAQADLSNAQATLALATVNADRQEKLVKTNVASVQDRDNAVTAMNVAKAQVLSRQAAVSQLERLQSFERVEAPFDGIITARSVDVGALIAAGSATSARELFHLVSIDWLRIYVSVPENYSPAMRVGSHAAVTLDEFPGETFDGVLVRTSNAIDQASRTLLVEVDVANPDGKLLPGSYVHVLFTLPTAANAVTIPANALLFRKEGLRVGVVHDNKVDLVPVKIGHDFGDVVEIVSGLKESDAIVSNPGDSLTSGTLVKIKAKETAAN